MNFIIRWLVTAIAVGVAVWIVPGMDLLGGTDAWVGIAIFGLILSLINISIKPIMQVLSLPISVITLGIFYLVVNTLMLYIAAWLANGIFQVGLVIDSFGAGERIGRQGLASGSQPPASGTVGFGSAAFFGSRALRNDRKGRLREF